MGKITFTPRCICGEHELSFTKDGKTYLYKTYDGSFANRVKNIAQRRPGTAWQVVKSLLIKEIL